MKDFGRKSTQRAVFSFWALLVGAGFWRLLVYSGIPGAPGTAGPRWPEAASLPRAKDVPTLVLFAHPRCPCSQASIGELERLMPKLSSRAKVVVALFKPRGRSEAWAMAGLWEKAREIPGVQTVFDEEGVEAARFGVTTSGQVLLYDRGGALVFSGGITPARGHMGDSDGRRSILSFVETGVLPRVRTAPVFGCSLKNPERASE